MIGVELPRMEIYDDGSSVFLFNAPQRPLTEGKRQDPQIPAAAGGDIQAEEPDRRRWELVNSGPLAVSTRWGKRRPPA